MQLTVGGQAKGEASQGVGTPGKEESTEDLVSRHPKSQPAQKHEMMGKESKVKSLSRSAEQRQPASTKKKEKAKSAGREVVIPDREKAKDNSERIKIKKLPPSAEKQSKDQDVQKHSSKRRNENEKQPGRKLPQRPSADNKERSKDQRKQIETASSDNKSKITDKEKGGIDEEDMPLSLSIDRTTPVDESESASKGEGAVKQSQDEKDAALAANLLTRRSSSGLSLELSLPPSIPGSSTSFRSCDANLFAACPLKDLEELQENQSEKPAAAQETAEKPAVAQETAEKPSFVPSKPAILPSIPKKHKSNPSTSSGREAQGKKQDQASDADQYASAR
eukprot:759967-Hanusia_phi.AAC.2